jgi:hypothetical protein
MIEDARKGLRLPLRLTEKKRKIICKGHAAEIGEEAETVPARLPARLTGPAECTLEM